MSTTDIPTEGCFVYLPNGQLGRWSSTTLIGYALVVSDGRVYTVRPQELLLAF